MLTLYLHDLEAGVPLNLLPWAPWWPHPSSGLAGRSMKKELMFGEHQPSAVSQFKATGLGNVLELKFKIVFT